MKINKSFEFYQSILGDTILLGCLDALRYLDNWEWNSCRANSGSLFLAFKGKNRDAFDFIPDVLSVGARVVVVQGEHRTGIEELQKRFPNSLFILEDPFVFLKRAASSWLALVPNLLKIGITGSNGKTTTKEVLASVLKFSGYSFYASEGNYNSDIGICLSILQLTGKEEVAVFEMGINQEGDMDVLVDLLRPQMAVITQFSHVHVGPLGGFEGVVKEKSKIARYADVLFCPKREADFLCRVGNVKSKVITYSLNDGIMQRERSSLQGEHFEWKGQDLFLSIAGEGALLAARAVLEIGKYLGLDYFAFKKGLSQVYLPYGRMQLITTAAKINFLHDAYNASISSLNVLISLLKTNQNLFHKHYRTFFIFSGFKELGEETDKAHKAALESILLLSWNSVFLIGEDLEKTSESFSFHHVVQYFKDMNSALDFFRGYFCPKDFVVLKGPRYHALERIINLFQGGNEE